MRVSWLRHPRFAQSQPVHSTFISGFTRQAASRTHTALTSTTTPESSIYWTPATVGSRYQRRVPLAMPQSCATLDRVRRLRRSCTSAYPPAFVVVQDCAEASSVIWHHHVLHDSVQAPRQVVSMHSDIGLRNIAQHSKLTNLMYITSLYADPSGRLRGAMKTYICLPG